MPVKMYFKNTQWHCPCGQSYDNYVTFCRDGCKEENETIGYLDGEVFIKEDPAKPIKEKPVKKEKPDTLRDWLYPSKKRVKKEKIVKVK